MVKDLRGHEVPAGGDGWAYREDMEQLSRTVNDVVPVANAEGRAALIEELSASEDGVPGVVLVSRADAPDGFELEYTTDGGTTWVPIVGETGGRTTSVLPNDSFAGTDTPDKYPMGKSIFAVVAATGWPLTTGLVETQRFLADRVQQIFHSTLSRAFYRSGADAIWSTTGWRGAAGPYATASGQATVPAIPAGTNKSTTITFPAGTFTKAPDIVVGARTSYPNTRGAVGVQSVTASSAALYIYNGSGATTDLGVNWYAVQMTNP